MSRVTHFPRYSQAENLATNNTLLVLRHLHSASSLKLERVLGELLDSSFSLGPKFKQQERHQHSVPDAAITQDPLRIYIETKMGNGLWGDQIGRHISSLAAQQGHVGSILIGLTKTTIDQSDLQSFVDKAAAQGVIFRSITFEQLADALEQACSPHDDELRSIIEDYRTYLSEVGLLDDRGRLLPIFPCGVSYKENLRYGLYYDDPNRRSKKDYRFIGIYKDKAVSLVGEVKAVLVCQYKNGGVVVVQRELGTETAEQLERIKGVMEYTAYYDLKVDPLRIYLVDTFYSTTLRKTSPGGIMGPRYVDAAELSGNRLTHVTAEELAAALDGKTFQ